MFLFNSSEVEAAYGVLCNKHAPYWTQNTLPRMAHLEILCHFLVGDKETKEFEILVNKYDKGREVQKMAAFSVTLLLTSGKMEIT